MSVDEAGQAGEITQVHDVRIDRKFRVAWSDGLNASDCG